jgi:hypothetical protein
MKAGVGAGFIIMPRFVSQLMGSSLPSGTVFPPQPGSEILDYQPPSGRRTSTREGRVRPERHNPHSIATIRITIARYLVHQLVYCTFCGSRSG